MTESATLVEARLAQAIESGRMPKELLVCGPAGTGKTYAILKLIHCLCSDYDNLRVLFLRATRASLTESILVTYEQEILPADGCEHIAAGQQRSHRHSYKYDNGSEIVLVGMDRNPLKALSTAWDIVYANEAIEIQAESWETISSRMDRPGRDDRFGWLIGDTNPTYPQHWLKQRCDKGDTVLWTTTHEANPALHDGKGWTPAGVRYLERLEKLSGTRYLRLRKGLWAAAEGLVYPGWNPDVHVIDPFEIPRGWRRMRAIDFGYTNPFVCQWWAIDEDDRMYLYREYVRCQKTVAAHHPEIQRLSEGESYWLDVADHDSEDRATLDECGIPTDPAHKAITTGIQNLEGRIAPQGDGRPRLFAFRDALAGRCPILDDARKPCGLAEEILGYLWASPKEGRAAKEEPVKLNDHSCDCARYAAAAVDDLGLTRIRFY